MHVHHSLYGNERVPANAFVLWNLFRDCLDPRHESEQLSKRARSPDKMSEKEPLLTASVKKHTEETQSESESESDDYKDGRKEKGLPDQFSPSDEENLEEAAFRYHNEDTPLVAPVVPALPKPPDKIKRKV